MTLPYREKSLDAALPLVRMVNNHLELEEESLLQLAIGPIINSPRETLDDDGYLLG